MSHTLVVEFPDEVYEPLRAAVRTRRRTPEELVKNLVSETVLTPTVDLREHGIGRTRAADLRARLRTFAEDWERPETEVYDAP